MSPPVDCCATTQAAQACPQRRSASSGLKSSTEVLLPNQPPSARRCCHHQIVVLTRHRLVISSGVTFINMRLLPAVEAEWRCLTAPSGSFRVIVKACGPSQCRSDGLERLQRRDDLARGECLDLNCCRWLLPRNWKTAHNFPQRVDDLGKNAVGAIEPGRLRDAVAAIAWTRRDPRRSPQNHDVHGLSPQIRFNAMSRRPRNRSWPSQTLSMRYNSKSRPATSDRWSRHWGLASITTWARLAALPSQLVTYVGG